MKLSPGLDKNYTWERRSNSFPGTTCMSGFLKNCQKFVPKSWGSPIQGTISDFLLNYGTYFPLVFTHFRTLSPGLGNIGTLECVSDSFPGTLPGKLLELRSNVQFFSNPGDNVMISAGISCSQDLRVQHTGDTYFLACADCSTVTISFWPSFFIQKEISQLMSSVKKNV